jgi:hypothetical protein
MAALARHKLPNVFYKLQAPHIRGHAFAWYSIEHFFGRR